MKSSLIPAIPRSESWNVFICLIMQWLKGDKWYLSLKILWLWDALHNSRHPWFLHYQWWPHWIFQFLPHWSRWLLWWGITHMRTSYPSSNVNIPSSIHSFKTILIRSRVIFPRSRRLEVCSITQFRRCTNVLNITR